MVKRLVQTYFLDQIKRRKSVLLLGPRQTGKTTLIKTLEPSLYLNLAHATERRKFELNPDAIIQMVDALTGKNKVIVIDEIQKVPAILDPIQTLIDDKKGQFILTGSSARKLRKQAEVNLLPGRVTLMRMDAFSQNEFAQPLEHHLYFGDLPAIALEKDFKQKNIGLRSYVDTYLEQEVRSEALVRNLPAFYRFLELASLEAGRIVSFNALSKDVGVAHTTISSYFEILEDCLIAERIDPITQSTTRKKLTKSSKYLFFDLGVRRLAANEGSQLGRERLAELFEYFCGIELVKSTREMLNTGLHFWRDPDGPEIDWVLKSGDQYIPFEVKWTESPTTKDIKHLQTFMNEYNCPHGGFVVCRSAHKLKLAKSVTALPWRELSTVVSLCE
jgi:uncharacterized protein